MSRRLDESRIADDYTQSPIDAMNAKPRSRTWRYLKFGVAASLAIGAIGLATVEARGVRSSAMMANNNGPYPGSGAQPTVCPNPNFAGLQINAVAATDSSNTDRLDFNTGLSAAENTTSALSLDVDCTS